jgi:hypothetical protein
LENWSNEEQNPPKQMIALKYNSVQEVTQLATASTIILLLFA